MARKVAPKNQRFPGDVVTQDGWGNKTYIRQRELHWETCKSQGPVIMICHVEDVHQTYIDVPLAKLLRPMLDKLIADAEAPKCAAVPEITDA